MQEVPKEIKRARIQMQFWKKVDKTTTPDGCWEWQGLKNSWGYGRFKTDKIEHNAHRVAWELTNGPIPGNLMVCHHCDNPACVRPDHLFLGTQSDNIFDSVSKGRQIGNTGNRKWTLFRLQKLKSEGLSQKEIAKMFHLNQSTISRALKRGIN